MILFIKNAIKHLKCSSAFCIIFYDLLHYSNKFFNIFYSLSSLLYDTHSLSQNNNNNNNNKEICCQRKDLGSLILFVLLKHEFTAKRREVWEFYLFTFFLVNRNVIFQIFNYMCKWKKKKNQHSDNFINSCKQANMTFSFLFFLFFVFFPHLSKCSSYSILLRGKKNFNLGTLSKIKKTNTTDKVSYFLLGSVGYDWMWAMRLWWWSAWQSIELDEYEREFFKCLVLLGGHYLR